MRMLKSLAIVFSLGVLLLMASNARADQWDQRTKITFSGPVQVANTQLPAGTYIFKLMDNMGNRNIVQIYNEDETHLIATIMAMPDYRLEATGSTAVKFAETSDGSQAAGNVPENGLPLKEWFYPGDSFGQEFTVKPVSQQVAETQPEPAAEPAPAPAPAAAAATPAPAPAAEPTPAESPAPQEAAPAAAPATDQTATSNDQNAAPSELPKTASDLPLMGLVGLLSLAAAAALRVARKITA